MKQSILVDKSKAFALRIIRMAEYIERSKINTTLTSQVLRSGTSIGANVFEAFYAQSRADFVSKLSISLKETAETGYWLTLLYESKRLSDNQFLSIWEDCEVLRKILIASINTSKGKNKKKNEMQEPESVYITEKDFDPEEELNRELDIDIDQAQNTYPQTDF